MYACKYHTIMLQLKNTNQHKHPNELKNWNKSCRRENEKKRRKIANVSLISCHENFSSFGIVKIKEGGKKKKFE